MKITHSDKALIIDDSSVMLVALRRMCLLLGYSDENITQAKSPKAALTLAKRTDYKLIVCDYNFNSRLNGRYFFDESKFNKLLKSDSVFIMVTGERLSSIVMSILELEPDEYYIKPFNPSFFVNRTKLALKRKTILSPLYEIQESQNYENLEQVCEEILCDHPEFYFQTLKIKGALLSRQSKHNEALKLYQDVLTSKKLEWASIGAAESLMELGDTEGADEIIAELLEQDNSSIKVVTLASKYDIFTGDVPNAIKHLSLASEIVPGNPDREYLIAVLCLSESDFKNAASRFYQYYELSIDTHRDSPSNIGCYISTCLMELDRIDKTLFFSDNHKSREFQLLIQERDGLEKDVIKKYDHYINVDSLINNSNDDSEEVQNIEFFSELIGAHIAIRQMKIKKAVSLLKKSFNNHRFLKDDEVVYLCHLLSKLSFHKEFSMLQEYLMTKIGDLNSPLSRARLELIKKIINRHSIKLSTISETLNDTVTKINEQDKIDTLTTLLDAMKEDHTNKKICYYMLTLLCETWPKNYGKGEARHLIEHCYSVCYQLMHKDEIDKSGIIDLYDKAILKTKNY